MIRFRIAARVGRVRCVATRIPEEWPSSPPKLARAEVDGQNPAYRPSDALFGANARSDASPQSKHYFVTCLAKIGAIASLSFMNHFASSAFWRSYFELPVEVRNLADQKFELLKLDPKHRSLHFKKVGRFWSVRVGNTIELSRLMRAVTCDGTG